MFSQSMQEHIYRFEYTKLGTCVANTQALCITQRRKGLLRVARFFVVQYTKTENIPQNIPKCHKIYQMDGNMIKMAIKFASSFQCKTPPKNLPKLGFLV
jgi:hypothetical protein